MPREEIVRRRVRNALTLAFVTDALAMPVHWFYDPKSITSAFGPQGVTDFQAPPAKHPYTFMSKPKPEANGKCVIGDIIHTGVAQHWGPDNRHVHATLSAGENTLNAEVARRVTLEQYRKRHADAGFNVDRYVDDYIRFMTSNPQLAKDCYAEGFHRAFFAKLNEGATAGSCADASEGAESVGGFTASVPTILLELARDQNVDRVVALAKDQVSRTHRRARLAEVVEVYVRLVAALLLRESDAAVGDLLQDAFAKTKAPNCARLEELLKNDVSAVIGIDGQPIPSSCDVSNSIPAILFVAAKYSDKTAEGILAGINIGGENCHRGFAGAPLLALTSDKSAEDAVARFAGKLADQSLVADIDTILSRF